MKPEFHVWAPDDSSEDDATLVLDVRDAEAAAREFVEANYSDLDFPTEIEICVKDQAGKVTKWTVTAEETVVFHATKNDEKAS